VESQQLASKVTQLEARVATLEDENKIVKGEVKQILTEIRSAILVRDNPFDAESAFGGKPAQVNIVRPSEPVAKVELHVEPERAPEPVHDAPPAPKAAAPAPAQPVGQPAREPLPLRPEYAFAPVADKPSWSLLTIASLSAWAEEAMGRIGALRLEILLDLCEAAGHITPEAREALSRVTELDIAEPLRMPSTNETAAILRQLETLVGDNDEESGQKLQRSA
jgi:hypothetical protein